MEARVSCCSFDSIEPSPRHLGTTRVAIGGGSGSLTPPPVFRLALGGELEPRPQAI